MDPTSQPELFVLLVMIAPAALAGVLMLVGTLVRRGKPLAWFGALAAALAYAVGHFFALPAPPSFPPAASNDALFWTAFIALAAGLAIGLRVRSRLSGAGIVALASAAATYFVLQRVAGRWSAAEQAQTFGGVALLSAIAWFGADRTASAARGVTAPLLLWIVATGVALAQALSGAASYASYTAALAAVLGAAIVLAFLRRETNYSDGLVAVVVTQIAALCAAGVHLAELPRGAGAALIVAPAFSALVGEPRAQSLGAKKALIVRAALVGAVVIAAVAWCAYEHTQRASSPYGY